MGSKALKQVFFSINPGVVPQSCISMEFILISIYLETSKLFLTPHEYKLTLHIPDHSLFLDDF